MPISEDEYDFRQGQEAQTTMSKAELRKTHKPIMEKRRRARINHSLNEIKSLILEAMKKDPARHSKLEKADILEMAVKHLQNVQRQQLALAMATDPSVLRKFKSGFNDCANEVGKYISQIEGVDQSMQQRVMGHLNKCINGIEQIAQINFPGFANLPFFGNFTPPASSTSAASLSVGDQNNNPTVHRLQLIPSRLPTGEFALLLPNSSNFPYFPLSSVPSQLNQTDSPNAQNPQNHRPSAFAKVTPSSQGLTEVKPLSPPQSPTNQNDVNLLNKNYQRSTSPQGFRPVNPQRNQQNLLASTSNDLHQVPQVSSTQTEVKQIKYPIHTYQERDKKLPSPKKFVEPLCIITNQTERFKQAQTKDESVTFEENYPRGVKRTFTEHQQGLLTVAYKDFSQPSPKIPKVLHEPNPSVSRNIFKGSEEKPSTSKSSDEGNSDMWRPW